MKLCKIFALTVGLGFWLTSCTTFPTGELSAYRDSFKSFSDQTEQLIIEYEKACERSPKLCPQTAPPDDTAAGVDTYGFPASISIRLAATMPSDDPTQARRDILSTIERYNSLLIALAEGQSEESVANSSKALLTSYNRLQDLAGLTVPIPAVAQAVALISPVISLLETARNRAEFKKAVIAGAPTIRLLLNQFALDGQDMYLWTAAESRNTILDIADTADPHYVDIQLLVGQLIAAGPVDQDRADRLNASIAAAVKGSSGIIYSPGIVGAPGATCPDAMLCTQIEQSVKLLQNSADEVEAISQKQQAFAAWIVSYGELIGQTQQALKSLEAANVAPVDVQAEAKSLLDVAFGVKKNLEAYKEARAAEKYKKRKQEQ